MRSRTHFYKFLKRLQPFPNIHKIISEPRIPPSNNFNAISQILPVRIHFLIWPTLFAAINSFWIFIASINFSMSSTLHSNLFALQTRPGSTTNEKFHNKLNLFQLSCNRTSCDVVPVYLLFKTGRIRYFYINCSNMSRGVASHWDPDVFRPWYNRMFYKFCLKGAERVGSSFFGKEIVVSAWLWAQRGLGEFVANNDTVLQKNLRHQ